MAQREFSFDSQDFAGMRYVIDEKMKEVIMEMKRKGLPSGAVSVKIDIGMLETPDENGEIRNVFVFDPKISSKIGKQFKAKCHAIGGEISFGEDGELMVGKADQVTIDELMEEQKKGA